MENLKGGYKTSHGRDCWVSFLENDMYVRELSM